MFVVQTTHRHIHTEWKKYIKEQSNWQLWASKSQSELAKYNIRDIFSSSKCEYLLTVLFQRYNQ